MFPAAIHFARRLTRVRPSCLRLVPRPVPHRPRAALRAYRLDDAGISALIEHMWQFLALTSETFEDWYAFDSEERYAANGDEPELLTPQAVIETLARG
jgi:hypothetical protein